MEHSGASVPLWALDYKYLDIFYNCITSYIIESSQILNLNFVWKGNENEEFSNLAK